MSADSLGNSSTCMHNNAMQECLTNKPTKRAQSIVAAKAATTYLLEQQPSRIQSNNCSSESSCFAQRLSHTRSSDNTCNKSHQQQHYQTPGQHYYKKPLACMPTLPHATVTAVLSTKGCAATTCNRYSMLSTQLWEPPLIRTPPPFTPTC